MSHSKNWRTLLNMYFYYSILNYLKTGWFEDSMNELQHKFPNDKDSIKLPILGLFRKVVHTKITHEPQSTWNFILYMQ
jgi:hypothetical protein